MAARQDRAGILAVARRAGVSPATVSRIVNRTRDVSPEIAERVRRAIDELGYFPDTQARSLASGRSRILGLIVSDITNPFFPELIHGFERIAVEQGYEVLLGSTNYDPSMMATVVRRMLERQVEGVAVMTSEFEKTLLGRLTERRIPLAFVDVGPRAPLVRNIRVDYRRGIEDAIQHLLRLGHRRVAFISGPAELKSAQARRSAFLESLRAARLKPALTVESDHSLEGGFQAVSRLLAGPRRPTAVLCSNDLTAIGVLRGLDAEGLRAPGDMSVIGFDDIHMAQFTLPPLTTVRLSRLDLASLAFRAITEVPAKARGYVLETRLIVRASTGPC